MTPPSTAEKRATFRQLHQSGCFLLPNPWDAGSARILQLLGYPAIATTSSGHAWACAKADGQVSRSLTLAHLRYMAEVSELPVNADFESGFALDAQGVFESVSLAIDTGVAGLSIEDSTGDPRDPLRDLPQAVERLQAARAAIDAKGGDTLLVGRAENFIVGREDLDDVLKRLVAYAHAGADCLYAPGLKTREQITAVVQAVAPKPVNVLVGWASDLSVQDLADLGVRRISLGGALARAALGGFMGAARSLIETGRFEGLRGIPSGQTFDDLFAAPRKP